MLIEVGPVNKIDTVIAFRSFFFLKFPGLLNLPAREKFILFMVSHKFFSKKPIGKQTCYLLFDTFSRASLYAVISTDSSLQSSDSLNSA